MLPPAHVRVSAIPREELDLWGLGKRACSKFDSFYHESISRIVTGPERHPSQGARKVSTKLKPGQRYWRHLQLTTCFLQYCTVPWSRSNLKSCWRSNSAGSRRHACYKFCVVATPSLFVRALQHHLGFLAGDLCHHGLLKCTR